MLGLRGTIPLALYGYQLRHVFHFLERRLLCIMLPHSSNWKPRYHTLVRLCYLNRTHAGFRVSFGRSPRNCTADHGSRNFFQCCHCFRCFNFIVADIKISGLVRLFGSDKVHHIIKSNENQTKNFLTNDDFCYKQKKK
ncbi:hypothetical protein HanIR_Chr16g0843221 [Helianthus annuus]|nr:hypothetical protein HanIR_Chr16g0843221 [Helianthus annuus]